MYSSTTICTVSYTGVRVLSPVSPGINNSCRARPVGIIAGTCHSWAVHINGIVLYHTSTGPAIVIYPVNLHMVMGITLNIGLARASNKTPVIVNIHIINNGSIAYYSTHSRPGNIVTINIRAIYIGARGAHPIIKGYTVIITERHIDAYPRAQRCPGIIIATGAPVNPCGSPFATRYPFPAVIIIIAPAAVMERCPAPFII